MPRKEPLYPHIPKSQTKREQEASEAYTPPRSIKGLELILEKLHSLGVPRNKVDSLFLYADQALDALHLCNLEDAFQEIMSIGHTITSITDEVEEQDAIYKTMTKEFIPKLTSELRQAVISGCNCTPNSP